MDRNNGGVFIICGCLLRKRAGDFSRENAAGERQSASAEGAND
ncbi:hypothetical protein PMI23_03902 [Pseudomonas sp. GM24]|jgi:hypothetical protein|nr:hypothetical protein PMI19_01544 [Pseudomonas sp. GM16]EJM33631.1 hypothetical protein PMI23_03902 [Pseudomonas sp. GM24]